MTLCLLGQRGAIGQPPQPSPRDFWAFRPLTRPAAPAVEAPGQPLDDLDRFVLAKLRAAGLDFAPEADRAAWARRVYFDLSGLPPSPEQLTAFLEDTAPGAYERLVDRLLDSPQYGVRWGKYWLDAAGYADSNGYFNADSDRPWAFRYRDYVVASLNADKPFDRFVREQLAGDELAGYRAGMRLTPETIEALTATHFLRNSQDGTGESDGNPDERLADKYAVLEGTVQIMGSTLFGLTLQCARCHDHKFEPVAQREYYRLQAVLSPAFNIEDWQKPNERLIEIAPPEELAAWQALADARDRQVEQARAEVGAWLREHRPLGAAAFFDDFDAENRRLAGRWSATAPGDDGPGGDSPVQVDAAEAPGAIMREGRLDVVESGAAANRWLSTRQAFDWTPGEQGASIQATFDLVDDRVGESKRAERVAYYIALHDYNDNGPVPGGNVLIDGNPAGGAAVHVDYPGADAAASPTIGEQGYAPGRNYGVRIVNVGGGRFRMQHLVDGVPEGKDAVLDAEALPDGGFGFEYCCGRSFRVDNVSVERYGPGEAPDPAARPDDPFSREYAARRQELDRQISQLDGRLPPRPGLLAISTDISASPPDVYRLERGQYRQRAEQVEPAGLAILSDGDERLAPVSGPAAAKAASSATHGGTGRRLAFANWLTRPGSRAAARLARVTVNRVWQHRFGAGLAPTPDNLGMSGAPTAHTETIDYLASTFVESGWSLKQLHRRVLLSRTYRQSSQTSDAAWSADPDNRMFGRFPLLRLDAEARRDAMLAVSGELDDTLGGPYIPTQRLETGEVVVSETAAGHARRSIFLQQRRTQVASLLEVFDAPTIVTSCTRRERTTLPLQSLNALNSDFVRARAKAFAARLARETGETGDAAARIERAFVLAAGRAPTDEERAAASEFLAAQPANYPGEADASLRAWSDFCQLLLASNAFLYVE